MKQSDVLDLHDLPEELKREIHHFYDYLVSKYRKKALQYKNGKKIQNDDRKETFLKSIENLKFQLPEDYTFNRDELHER